MVVSKFMRWTRHKIGNQIIMVGEPEVTSEIIGDKIMVRIRQPVLRLPDEEKRDNAILERPPMAKDENEDHQASLAETPIHITLAPLGGDQRGCS